MADARVAEHLPARSLLDIQLDEDLYKADFELSSRYDQLARELERLALLGVGAYGFLITKSDMADSANQLLRHHFGLPALGLFALGVCAACALICSYLNSRCLKLQVDILRLLGRIESGRWQSQGDSEVNRQNLEHNRTKQKRMLLQGRSLIFVAVLALITGAGATVLCFILTLTQVHHEPGRSGAATAIGAIAARPA